MMNLPFRKKKAASNPAMPPGVQQYYKAETRDRTGVAWLLAILTLLVTVAIILGLFFGGRWIYRKIHDRNKTTTTQTTNTTNTTQKSTNGSSTSGSSAQPAGNSSSNGSSASGSTGSTSNNSSNNSSSGNTNSSTGSTASNGATTGSTGVVSDSAARTNLPNTGPGDTIAIFFAVSLFGYLAHRYLTVAKK